MKPERGAPRSTELETAKGYSGLPRAADRRIAVLCLENDQRRCHRQVVLEAALALEPALDVLPRY